METSGIVKELQKKYKNLHLITETSKRGLGAAYIDAMDKAFNEYSADGVITFDADLSHDANIIPKMVEEASNETPKYIGGTRYKKGGGIPPEWGFHRKLLSYFGNFFARTLFFNYGLSDFTSGFKLIRKEVFEKVRGSMEKGLNGYTFCFSFKFRAFKSWF